MKLIERTAPFWGNSHSVDSMLKDILLVLVFCTVMPVIFYGWRAAALVALCAAVCAFFETLFRLLAHRPISLSDISPVITGVLIALLMPAGIPLYIPVIACAAAILVARGPFGFTGHMLFEPAAVGVALVTVLYPETMFCYYNMSQNGLVPMFMGNFPHAASPAAMLHQGLKPELLPSEMFLGYYAGPMGATATLVIAAGAIFLFVRRDIDFKVPTFFVLSSALYAAVFPRIISTPIRSVQYELLSGSLIFCAVFLTAQPGIGPKTSAGKCVYGFLGGIFIMLLRTYGAYEQEACFAVILMGAVSPWIDEVAINIKNHRRRRKNREKSKIKTISNTQNME